MPKLFNLKDKKFGDLTVKEYLGYDKHNNKIWLCECICGNTVKIRSTILTTGKKTNCGCKSVKKQSLINKKFGNLTVKEFAGYDKHKNRLWLCECTCGNKVKVATTHLITGQRTNCGCKGARKPNLVNQKFGDLTVKEFAGTDKRGSRLWLCECTCGETVKVETRRLKSGEKTNCGCKKKLGLINQKFGDLVVREITGINKYGDKVWLCECTCGNKIKVSTKMLKWGLKVHCGCKNKQEVKQETTKHIEKIQMIQTEHKTVQADYNVFKICDNDLTSFNKMEILDKKNLILKLTQKVLEEAKSSASLDLFLTFLTGRKSNLGYLY